MTLIDRDALPVCNLDMALRLVWYQDILAAPVIDAAPVVHGQWKTEVRGRPDNGGTYGVSICSVCGFEQSCTAKGNYCPNCGAEMGKGADG